jgi:hypothetical protein
MMADGAYGYSYDALARTMREQFNKGLSLSSLAVFLGVTLGVALLMFLLSRLQGGPRNRSKPDDASRLFQSVLSRLRLTFAQRRLLKAMARELRLGNPSVILLSRARFQRAAEEYRVALMRAGNSAGAVSPQSLGRLSRALFP